MIQKNIITVKCKLSEKENNWSEDLTQQLRSNVLDWLNFDLQVQDFGWRVAKATHTYINHNRVITFKFKTAVDISGIDLKALEKTVKTGQQGVFYLDDVTLLIRR